LAHRCAVAMFRKVTLFGCCRAAPVAPHAHGFPAQPGFPASWQKHVARGLPLNSKKHGLPGRARPDPPVEVVDIVELVKFVDVVLLMLLLVLLVLLLVLLVLLLLLLLLPLLSLLPALPSPLLFPLPPPATEAAVVAPTVVTTLLGAGVNADPSVDG